MKRIKKKLGFAFLGICILVLAQAMVSFAAEGTLQFSSPTGNVGDNITVTVKMSGNGAPIGDGDATLTYDAAKLEFVSGTNATGGNGTVTLSAAGTGTEVELNYEMVFKALAEGTSTIEVTSSTAYLFSDETLYLQHGNATVTVGNADSGAQASVQATGNGTIDISGTVYTVYNDFSDALVPDGFSRAALIGDGYTYSGIQQDVSGKQFIYAKKEGSEDPQMVLYDETNGFVLASPAMLTGEKYIYILGVMDGSSLPDTFGETTLDLNGTIFPVWQDSENTSFYVVNALGPSGEISFYQYDTVDGTYQRYFVEEKAAEEEEEAPAGNELIDQVKTFIDENLIMVAAVVVAVICLLVLILIIQGVILGNKKAELEDLQEDLELDLVRSKKKKKNKKKFPEEDEFEEDFDDFDDEDNAGDYEEDDYYDEYEDEYDDTYEDEYEDEYDDTYEDEYEDGDEEDQENNYDIDFVDL